MWPANLILAHINHILKAEKLFLRRLTFFLPFLFDTFSIELKTENGYKISEKYINPSIQYGGFDVICQRMMMI